MVRGDQLAVTGDVEVVQVVTVHPGGAVQGDIIARQNVYQYSPPRPVDGDTCAAAYALLEAMPTSDQAPIAEIATLPHGSYIKGLRPNPHFVGRTADMRTLAKALKAQRSSNPVAITTGIGGIGKTQLAIEFAHRYGGYFAGGVFWVSFARAENVPAEVAACGAGPLVDWRPDYQTLKQEEQVQLVMAAWQSPLPRLLIFDNCEDEALLNEWRPPTGGCRVLVTSRRATWSASLGVTSMLLGVLARNESIALLQRHRPDLRDADADALAAELGDLPLALHLAGSTLETYRDDSTFGDPGAFLAELRSANLLDHEALQGIDATPSPTNHELHVAKTFALSYDRLDPAEPADARAIQLLARAACLAPGEPIPRDLLLATLALDENDRAAARQAARGIHRLLSLGLLEEDDAGALRLHRLLAMFVQQTVVDADAQGAVNEAVRAVASRINNAGYPSAMQTILAHLHHVTDSRMQRNDAADVLLRNTLGYYLQTIGDLVGARLYYERALAIAWQVLGKTHPDTATSLNNLGMALQMQGDLAGARPYLEQALAIYEQAMGETHPNTATSLNNLGFLLQSQGNLEGARPYLEQALAIRMKTVGEMHPNTAQSLNNLGCLLQMQGDLVGARPYYERALAIYQQEVGELHPDKAQSLNNLGSLLQAQGNLTEARPYLERALVIYQQAVGELHPGTARCLNNLGSLLQAQGNLAEARPYYEQALAIRTQTLGEAHPDTATSLNDLGMLLQAQGNLTEARPYLERALAIYQQAVEDLHPNTATSLNNIGLLLQKQGNLAEARLYYERALAIRTQTVGELHPDTATSLNNLGMLLQAQGNLTEARPYLEQALAIYQQAVGELHPNTATSLNNIGLLLQAQGNLVEARPYLERTLAIYRQAVGELHPDTATILGNMVALLQAQGNLTEARPYYERALAICQEVLGTTHPDTARGLNNLGMLLQAQGDLAGARPYYAQALAICESRLGPDHPNTHIVRNNLAAINTSSRPSLQTALMDALNWLRPSKR
jgi:tetratricopeptide (TPR) repeat protein